MAIAATGKKRGCMGLLGGSEWVPEGQGSGHKRQTTRNRQRKDPGLPILSHCTSLSHYGKLWKRPALMPPDLRAFLTLHATVSARDEEATRQVLRDVATTLPVKVGHKVVTMLERAISTSARVWLQRLA